MYGICVQRSETTNFAQFWAMMPITILSHSIPTGGQ